MDDVSWDEEVMEQRIALYDLLHDSKDDSMDEKSEGQAGTGGSRMRWMALRWSLAVVLGVVSAIIVITWHANSASVRCERSRLNKTSELEKLKWGSASERWALQPK